MKKLINRIILYLGTINKTTIGILALCFTGIDAAASIPLSIYLNDIYDSLEEDLIEDDIIPNEIDIDTIGNDSFINVGLISGNGEQLESYYAITSEGYLYTWGWNLNGELGLGTTDEYVSYPTFVNLDGSFYDVNENGIKDNGEKDTITDGDKVSKIEHINKVYVNDNQVEKAIVMAISQEGYLYMWGDSQVLPNSEIPEYKYSNSKISSNLDSYISPVFVNLDNSYLKDDFGNNVQEQAYDTEGLLYKDSSNNNVNVNIPTKTEGDKVKNVDMYESTSSIYAGLILSNTGELYGWGSNSKKTLDYDALTFVFIDNITKINYGSSDTYGDIHYEEVLISNNIDGTIGAVVALGSDGYIYMWGSTQLIPTVDSSKTPVSPRIRIDLSDPAMSLDTSRDTTIESFSYSVNNSSLQLITADDYLYTIGSNNDQGASGRGCNNEPNDEKFYRVDIGCNNDLLDDKVKTEFTSDFTSYLINEDDYLYMYGKNVVGQAGQGNTTQVNQPSIVDIDNDGFNGLTSDEDDKVTIVDTDNANHTGTITKSGDLYMWGLHLDEHGIMPNTSDNAFTNKFTVTPTKVNFVDYEEGEKYTTLDLWNVGGITSTDYLNIYYWGGYIPNEERVTNNLKNVHKLSKDDFLTPATALEW